MGPAFEKTDKTFQKFSKLFKTFQKFSKISKMKKVKKHENHVRKKWKKYVATFHFFWKTCFDLHFTLLQNMKITSYDGDLHSKVIGALFNIDRNDETEKSEKMKVQNTFARRTFATFKNTFSCCEHANHVICDPARDPFFH